MTMNERLYFFNQKPASVFAIIELIYYFLIVQCLIFIISKFMESYNCIGFIFSITC